MSGKNWWRLKVPKKHCLVFRFCFEPWTLICVPGWRGATLLGLRCHTTKRIKASEAAFGGSATKSLWVKPRTADEYRSPRLLAKQKWKTLTSPCPVSLCCRQGRPHDEFFPEYVVRFSVLCHCLLGLIKAHCIPICSVGVLYLAVRFNRSRLVLV